MKVTSDISDAIQINSGNHNFTVQDSLINASDSIAYDINFSTGTSGTVNFTNVTSNGKFAFSGTTTARLNVHWYLDAFANYTNSSNVTNANISAWNVSGDLAFSNLTGGDGRIPQQILLEFTRNKTLTQNYNNYTFNATDPDKIENLTQSWNMTTNRYLVFTFNSEFNAPNIRIVYPTNASNFTYANVNVNYTVSDVNLESCKYTSNSGSTNTTITCGNNITDQTWNDGVIVITVYAKDTSGLENSSTVTFNVDARGPFFNNTFPNKTYAIAPERINFSTNVIDVWKVDSIWFQHNFDVIVIETESSATGTSNNAFGSTTWRAQSFVFNNAGKIKNGTVTLLYNTGTARNITVEIRTDSAGSPSSTVLANATINAFTSTTATDYLFNFTAPADISGSVPYWLVLSSPSSSSTSTYRWRSANNDNAYTGGTGKVSTNSGSSWSDLGRDYRFLLNMVNYTYKNETPVLINAASGFTSNVKLLDTAGTFSWGYCANDSLGRINCTMNSFYVYGSTDTIIPNITFTSYPVGKINGEKIGFAGYVEDDSFSWNISLWVKNGTNPYEFLSVNSTGGIRIYLSYKFNSSKYATGDNLTFKLEGYDSAGNSNQTNITLQVDHLSPILSENPAVNPSITPDKNWYGNGDNITLRINLTDGSGAGMKYVQVDLSNINGTGYVNMTLQSGNLSTGVYSFWNYSVMVNTSSGADKKIDFFMVDAAIPIENTINYSITYSVDNDFPYYNPNTVITLPDPAYKNQDVTHISKWLDSSSGLSTCILSTNASGTFLNYTQLLSGNNAYCSISVNYTTNGTYSYIFYVNDSTGKMNNTGFRSVVISDISVINVTEVHLIYPLSNSTFYSANLSLTVNVTNVTQNQLDSCWIIVDGIINATNNSMLVNYNWNFSITLETGNYDFDACCNNTDGIISCSNEGGALNITLSIYSADIIQTISFNSFIDKIMGFIRTSFVNILGKDLLLRFTYLFRELAQLLDINDFVTRILLAFRASNQVININAITGRFITIPRAIAQLVDINDAVARLFVGFTNIAQVIDLNDAVFRIFAGFRGIFQNFQLINAVFTKVTVGIQTFTREVFDIVDINDAVFRVFIGFRNSFQVVDLNDTTSRIFGGVRFIFDVVDINDATFRIFGSLRGLFQVIDLNDAVTRVFGVLRDVSQVVDINDATTRLFVGFRSNNQLLTLNAVASERFSAIRRIFQVIDIQDSTIRILYAFRGVFQTLAINEFIIATFTDIGNLNSREVFDTFSLNNMVSTTILRVRYLPQSLNLNILLIRTFAGFRNVFALLDLNDAVTRFISIPRFVSQIVDLNDAVFRSFGGFRTIAQIIDLNDAVFRIFAGLRGVAQIIDINDAIVRLFVGFRNIFQRINVFNFVFTITPGEVLVDIMQVIDMNDATQRVTGLFIRPTQGINLFTSISAFRFGQFIVNVQQSISINTAIQRIVFFFTNRISSFRWR
ncbi:hypothetical protein HYV49_00635 [Candidatus Pacearchaeota archaeon]|nr:hypothetical protein [Candidatus Pacearchaeota archaeon]